MIWDFNKITNLFMDKKAINLLSKGSWGIEKESARTTLSGDLALTDHPSELGDKFTNPYITTDFSESQIEIITPPFKSIPEAFNFLLEKQIIVENNINEEILWPLSMPPRLPDEEIIPIAKYSHFKEGSEKELYRNGLALRYGKKMQLISGIHYNFSFSDDLLTFLYGEFGENVSKQTFIDDLYFSLTRNYLRYRWLLIYLFGASPSIDETYESVIDEDLKVVEKCCAYCSDIIKEYKNYATSLRVSRFGYSSSLQRKYNVSFNSLEEYVKDIDALLSTKSKTYNELGLFRDGTQVQLNDNVLQRESEFYSSIRFKQTPKDGQRQIDTLISNGIKYIEVRILDLNPFEKTGLNLDQLYFLHIFLIFCLFENSPYITEKEYCLINENHHAVALLGRKNNLQLKNYNNDSISLIKWCSDILAKMKVIAKMMDSSLDSPIYENIINNEYKKIEDISLLPSEIIAREMTKNNENHIDFGIRMAVTNKNLN